MKGSSKREVCIYARGSSSSEATTCAEMTTQARLSASLVGRLALAKCTIRLMTHPNLNFERFLPLGVPLSLKSVSGDPRRLLRLEAFNNLFARIINLAFPSESVLLEMRGARQYTPQEIQVKSKDAYHILLVVESEAGMSLLGVRRSSQRISTRQDWPMALLVYRVYLSSSSSVILDSETLLCNY